MSRRDEVGVKINEWFLSPMRQSTENDLLRDLTCTLASEVDELRAELKAVREAKVELNGIMDAMTKGANESAVIDALLAMLEPGSGSFGREVDNKTVALTMAEWRLLEQIHARALEIAGRKPK